MKTITTIIYYGMAGLLMNLWLPVRAQGGEGTERSSGVLVSNVDISRTCDSVTVSLDLVLDDMEVGANRSVVLQPLLAEGADKAWLPAVEVMGRRRHLYYQRNGHRTYAEGRVQVVRRSKDRSQTVRYSTTLPYEPWMDHARLDMTEDLCGCGQVQSNHPDWPLGRADIAFVPRLAYVMPQAVTRKMRELKGSAYLDFPVNKTDIHPYYRRNPQELGKIRSTIDTVQRDPDASITTLYVKGYASPEGTWRLNTRLAKGRTEALVRYLTDRYNFPDTLFVTDYEPENWQGLRAYVRQTGLRDKEDILALIDSDLQPDVKEARLKREHAESYRQLYAECYPGLRRTDYVVTYQIRGFNVEEAKARIFTEPQKLSLQEMFAVAQTYPPGSEDFNRVFDVAVRMYPDDPVANLNAANALLENGYADAAFPYLEKAGDSPQADNARGVALLLLRRYDEAVPLLQRAVQAGVTEAEENMKITGFLDSSRKGN